MSAAARAQTARRRRSPTAAAAGAAHGIAAAAAAAAAAGQGVRRVKLARAGRALGPATAIGGREDAAAQPPAPARAVGAMAAEAMGGGCAAGAALHG